MHHGYLGHVIKVFQQVGYEVATGPKQPLHWDVLWSHEYPFMKSFSLPQIESHQKVNHFPGSGFITNKVNLATSGLKYVPKAFNLPREKESFLKFVSIEGSKARLQEANRKWYFFLVKRQKKTRINFGFKRIIIIEAFE